MKSHPTIIRCLQALALTLFAPTLQAVSFAQPAASRAPAPAPDAYAASPAEVFAAGSSWEVLTISGRLEAAAIYDPSGERMLVFGGRGLNDSRDDVWSLSLQGAPTWTRLPAAGTPPPVPRAYRAVYDPVRERMLVVPPSGTPVWELTLTGLPLWRTLVPTGTPPGLVGGHSTIYDPVRDRIVLFGGSRYAGGSLDWVFDVNEVWALSLSGTPAWSQLSPAGGPPSPQSHHSAVYDPVRDRMIVFGGPWSPDPISEVWALSLSGTPTWNELAPAGTPPAWREWQGASYDAAHDCLVVWGGLGMNGFLGDVWALSLGDVPAWTALVPAGPQPVARLGPSVIYDPARGRTVVFGGRCVSGALSDVWALSLEGVPSWTALGAAPSPREGQSAIYDPQRGRIVVFGGDDGYARNDVWALSLDGAPAWTPLAPSGPAPAGRAFHSAIYDPGRDRMVVFGGYDGAAPLGDTWELTLGGSPAWRRLNLAYPPAPRYGHGAIYDPGRDRVVVFGGYDGAAVRNDTWALSLGDSPAWRQLTTAYAPTPRYGPGAIYDPVRDRMLVFGGYGAGHLDDAWELPLADPRDWLPLMPAGTPPSARAWSGAIYDPGRDRMVVIGGHDGSARNDVWALSLGDEPAWTTRAPAGSPPMGRLGHSAVYDPGRDRMIVLGGYSGQAYLDDVWALAWGFGQDVDIPEFGFLRPAVPNPTSGSAALSYSLARAGRVQLRVYDLGGRLVRTLEDGERHAGPHTVTWDGADDQGARLRSGIYFVRLSAPGLRVTGKVVLAR